MQDIQESLQHISLQSVKINKKAITQAGDGHFYQYRTTFFVALQSLIISFILQGQVFLFYPPIFQCKDTKAITNALKRRLVGPMTSESIQIHSPRQYKNFICTVIMQFRFNYNIATLFFCQWSDRFGRLFSIGAIATLISSFSTNWPMFMVGFVIVGCGMSPFITICFVLLNEISGEKFRSLSSIIFQLSWGLGQIIFIFIAMRYKDWKTQLLYFVSIPALFQIFSFIWIHESPKYLTNSDFYV